MNCTAVSEGNAMIAISAVANMSQQKIGMRHIDMPGARKTRIVTIKLIDVTIDEMLVSVTPRIHRSSPAPPATCSSESGVYAYQPTSEAPPSVKKPERIVMPPSRYIQYEYAFIRGNATSGAPICSGTR